jgi:hypothetical protein
MTVDELQTSPFVTGKGIRIHKWDQARREQLASNARYVINRLRQVGYQGEIAVDGSFVEACIRPADIDIYCRLSDEETLSQADRLAELNALEGEPVWAFEEEQRLWVKGFLKPIAPLTAKYRVDLHFDHGQWSGVFGPRRELLTIPELFHQERSYGASKGIINIVSPQTDNPQVDNDKN